MDYGLAYPMTYEFYIPNEGYEYSAFLRYRFGDDWIEMVEKTSNDFFNGIEAVRFDYIDRRAYVSVGFSSFSDSIFIKFEDSGSWDGRDDLGRAVPAGIYFLSYSVLQTRKMVLIK